MNNYNKLIFTILLLILIKSYSFAGITGELRPSDGEIQIWLTTDVTRTSIPAPSNLILGGSAVTLRVPADVWQNITTFVSAINGSWIMERSFGLDDFDSNFDYLQISLSGNSTGGNYFAGEAFLFGTLLFSGCSEPGTIVLDDFGDINGETGSYGATISINWLDGFDTYQGTTPGQLGSLSCAVLPVELLFFKAEKKNQTSVLSWATATEINNDHFDIEHSPDGIDFRSIGKVKGAGTTEQPQNYEFIHRQPVTGTNYYRLRQVDFDGAFEYSSIETVTFEDDRQNSANFRIFPNPTGDHLMILPPDTGKSPWNIDVFDVQGKLMASFIMNSSHRLDTDGWPAGVYHIRIGNGNQNESLRFIKQ